MIEIYQLHYKQSDVIMSSPSNLSFFMRCISFEMTLRQKQGQSSHNRNEHISVMFISGARGDEGAHGDNEVQRTMLGMI